MSKWEQWLESEEGRKAMDVGILKDPSYSVYLKNRLYWAFHAGVYPLNGKLDTVAETLLREVANSNGNYLTNSMKRRIRSYLEAKI